MLDFCGARGRGRALALATVLFGSLAAWPAVADDTDAGWLDGVYSGEFGARFWYGMGQTGKDLYGTDGTTMVSRLTYGGLTGGSGEVFGQINERNYFIKGVAGIGRAHARHASRTRTSNRSTSPYSSTDSSLHRATSATSRSTAAAISLKRPMPAWACSPATAFCTRR